MPQIKEFLPFGCGKCIHITARERQVLCLVAKDFPSKLIARQLNISIKTVEKHRANLISKLKVHGAAGLTAYAIQEWTRLQCEQCVHNLGEKK